MKTLDLYGAAEMLQMHPNTVRILARDGELPASKVGKRWVFIEEDLANAIREGYSAKWQMAQGLQEKTLCESTNETESTTQTTRSMEKEYENLLKLPIRQKPNSSS